MRGAKAGVSPPMRSPPCTGIILLAELNADLFSRHASPLEVYVFVAVDDRGEDVCPTRFVVDATENRKAAKDPWRPKCAAPRLVYDSALFFETFIHVYIRITYDQICSAIKKKKHPGGQVSGWTCRTRVQKFRIHLLKASWTF